MSLVQPRPHGAYMCTLTHGGYNVMCTGTLTPGGYNTALRCNTHPNPDCNMFPNPNPTRTLLAICPLRPNPNPNRNMQPNPNPNPNRNVPSNPSPLTLTPDLTLTEPESQYNSQVPSSGCRDAGAVAPWAHATECEVSRRSC